MICLRYVFPLIFLGGCMVFETGPADKTELPKERLDTSISIQSFDKVRTSIRPDSGHASLILDVVGDLQIESEQEVVVKESVSGRTAFGLFPWTLADKPGGTPVVDHVMALLVNYGLALTPTLYSLFFEPFSDYPDHGVNDHVFAGFSIFGFYRYCGSPIERKSSSRTDKHRREAGVYRVNCFSVESNGVRYKSENGVIVLPDSYESGMELDCRLTSVDVLPGDLKEKLSSYVGKDLKWTATGKRRNQGKELAEVKTSISTAITSSLLEGKWESYQSHKSRTQTANDSTVKEHTQVLHDTYEFLKDGTFRQIKEVSGTETVWTGSWKVDDNVLWLSLKTQHGESVKTGFRASRVESGEIELQYADLRAYEKMFIRENVKIVSASYNDKSELCTHMVVEIDVGTGKGHQSIFDSVYSPLILEKL